MRRKIRIFHRMGKSICRRHKAENLWELYNPSQLRLWPKDNSITYFSDSAAGRSMPPKYVNSAEHGIRAPHPLPVDIFRRHRISLLGSAEHSKGYYHSRLNENFFDFICVKCGSLWVKSDDVKRKLSEGEALIVPPNTLCDSFIERGKTSVLWVHFDANSFWAELLGGEISIKKLENYEALLSAFKLYEMEVFSARRSSVILEEIADIAAAYLKREFSEKEKALTKESLEGVLRELCGNHKKFTTPQIAKKFGMSARTLDEYCKKTRSESFSRLVAQERLKAAFRLLRTGKISNSGAAARAGYANAYSFSKAFRRAYGFPPGAAKK